MSKFYNATLKPALIYGAMLGAVMVVYSLVIDVLGATFSKANQPISLIIVITGIFVVMYLYRKDYTNNLISYEKALGFGVLVSLVMAVITSIFQVIYVLYINTEFYTQMIQMMEEKFLEKGVPEAQIEQAMAMQKRFLTPGWGFVMGIFSTTFMGTIISLIAAIFIKRKPANPFEGVENEQ